MSFTQSAPTATRAIVGHTSSGSAATIDQYVATAAETQWNRRVESYVDQSSETRRRPPPAGAE